MATGFGNTSTRTENIVKSLENSSLVNSSFLDEQRQSWHDDYSRRISKEFTEEELFNPKEYLYCGPNDKIEYRVNPGSPAYNALRYQRLHEIVSYGYWNLKVTQDMRGIKSKYYQEWDFTISVWSGDRYMFHPLQSRNNIVRFHGIDIFEKWRKTVLDDLANFADVIKAYNPPVSMFSVTCCNSSERVCKQLGLVVRKGFAYLTHRKGEECQLKSGSFMPVAG